MIFLCYNIRSIPKNLLHLTTYLETVLFKFTIIGITETWLKEHNVDSYNIHGYNIVHNYRRYRMGGGVCLLMRDVVSFIQRNELTISNDYVEALFIEIITKNEFIDYSILVGVIYRPPNTDLNKFNETMYQILDQLKSEKKSCVIMGDFNLNFCNYETHQLN